MTHRDPYRDDEHLQTGRTPEADPTVRASSRRAVWSWITGLAIVFILFFVFYGLNSQRDSSTVTSAAPPATTTSSQPTTTGQGGAPSGESKSGESKSGAAPSGESKSGESKSGAAPANEGAPGR